MAGRGPWLAAVSTLATTSQLHISTQRGRGDSHDWPTFYTFQSSFVSAFQCSSIFSRHAPSTQHLVITVSPPVTIIPRLLVWAECNNNNPRLGSAVQPRVSGVSARSLTRVAWREARPVALEPSVVHRSLQPSSRTHQLIGSCRGKQRFIFVQIFLIYS